MTDRVAELGPVRPNATRVLNALAGHGELSRAALASVLGLPKSTVVGLVDDLMDRGLVVEGGERAAVGAGRPAKAIRLAGPRRVLGVAVWSAGRLRAAIAEPQGRIVASSDIPLDAHQLAAGIVDPLVERMDELLGQAALERGSLTGVVLGVPAPFQRGTGRSRSHAGTVEATLPRGYAAWLDSDPGDEVTARLRVPSIVENDANLGALGEGAFGAARGLDTYIYVKIAPGAVGAGIVFGGRLHRGVSGYAGELAHIQVSDDGPLCHCGGRGCLIGLLDATLLGVPQPSYDRPPPLHELLSLAEQGAAGPRRILVDLGRTLGRPLADLCTFLNPAAVVVDGSLGPAGTHVIDGIRQAIERHSAPVAVETTRLLAGELGERADLLGAVILARNESLTDVAGQ